VIWRGACGFFCAPPFADMVEVLGFVLVVFWFALEILGSVQYVLG
jgi:hypothetical protein